MIWYIVSYDVMRCRVNNSDVKRGQNLDAETEAEARVLRPRPGPEAETEAIALRSRPRPRPISWGRGQAEAKDKVMNKKYQMMVDNIQVNLCHYDQNDTVYFSFSLAHSNYLLS